MKNIIIGMSAWSLLHGEGEIKSYDGNVIVVRIKGVDVKFDHRGHFEKFPNQILFFSKPVIDALAVPAYKARFKENEQVLISRHQDGANAKVIKVGYENEHCVTTQNGFDYLKNEWFFFTLGLELVMT